jgi:hypothetical protein
MQVVLERVFTLTREQDGEFSGGPGLIDALRRSTRVIGQQSGPLVQGVGEELMEIYAVDLLDPNSTPETSALERPSNG